MTDLNFARTRLETAVANGLRSAGPVIEQVLSQLPQDEIVAAQKTTLEVDANGRARFVTPEADSMLNDHAFGQLISRTGAPVSYARDLLASLREGKPEEREANRWRGDLLQHMVSQHLQHASERFLVRRVDGVTRGVLSDAFKRIDTRPMLDAFVKTASDLGAVPLSGHATETRVAVRALIPRIYEPVPGEAIAFGLHYGNSDFGAGAYHVTAFALRLWCLNGAVGDAELKKTHVGARLADNISYSRRTHQLTERALVSQTKDVVRALLGTDAIEAKLDAIRAVHSKEVDFETAWKTVGKTLSKGDKEAAKVAFESPDTINLPAGQTMYRFANALSWVANHKETGEEKRLDLQAISGKLLGI
jgi:hypothetical protein